MSSITEIEKAIEQLSPDELIAFRAWFAQRDAQLWDRQFEADAQAGKLDALANDAIRDLHEGRCSEL